MITKIAPERQIGRGSFTDIRLYLERKNGAERQDLIGSWSGNVAAHRTADLEMERVASRGKSKDPVYHVILSWRPGELVEDEVLHGSINATLRSLGAESHQWFAAAHIDDDTHRTHLHLVVNKVHPLHLKLHNRWHEKYKVARSSEWIETAYGCLSDRHTPWRQALPEVDLGISFEAFEAFEAKQQRNLAEGIHVAPDGASLKEIDSAYRAKYSWVSLLEKHLKPTLTGVLSNPQATWNDLHAACETYGVHLVKSGSGLRLIGGEVGQHVKASRLGLQFSAMEKQLGAYQISANPVVGLAEKVPRARSICAGASSWKSLYQALHEHKLTIKKFSLGGQILDTETGETLPLGRTGTTLPRLVSKLGKFQEDQMITERDDRENERKAQGIAERLAEIGKEPNMLLDRLTMYSSVWSRQDIIGEVSRMVGTDVIDLKKHHSEGLLDLVAAVEHESIVLGDVPMFKAGELSDDKDVLMTVKEIQDEEDLALAEFDRLISRSRELALRPHSPDAALNTEQQNGYMHLSDGSSDFQLLTGIAGAGKSRLLRDVCAAYNEAGYTVIGTAVAGDAARTLGEEAQISGITVARLLAEVERGDRALDERTVVILDEATQLGAADGLRLAKQLNLAGSRLLATGDCSQHGSVARGPIIEEIAGRVQRTDISETRRAHAQWLREVGKDFREGRTGRALTTLREKGSIGEYRTVDEAMSPLLEGYVRDIREGRSALMIATTRAAVHELNVRVREVMKDDLGERRDYQTTYGKRDFAIGDRVVTRRGVRNLEMMNGEKIHVVNGEQWRVCGHRNDGRLELERVEADLKQQEQGNTRVAWDLERYPEIDWSMATTSYRSQGRTVDSVYTLLTPADAQRAMYVDVTRARKNVFLSYSREEITDFGHVLELGNRERAKLTVAGAMRYISSVSEEIQKKQQFQAKLDHLKNVNTQIQERIEAEKTMSTRNTRGAGVESVEENEIINEKDVDHKLEKLKIMDENQEENESYFFLEFDDSQKNSFPGYQGMRFSSIEEAQQWVDQNYSGTKEVIYEIGCVQGCGCCVTGEGKFLALPAKMMDTVNEHLEKGLIVTGFDEGSRWGGSSTIEAYVEFLKKLPVSKLFTMTIDDGSVCLRNRLNIIIDSGTEIRSKEASYFDIRSILDLASAKGWKQFHIAGDVRLASELLYWAKERDFIVDNEATIRSKVNVEIAGDQSHVQDVEKPGHRRRR